MELRGRSVLAEMGKFELQVLYARAMTRVWEKVERLRRIFSEVFITENAKRCMKNRILIMQNERIEGIKIAILCRMYERSFVHS